jgi:hypothetical protein
MLTLEEAHALDAFFAYILIQQSPLLPIINGTFTLYEFSVIVQHGLLNDPFKP